MGKTDLLARFSRMLDHAPIIAMVDAKDPRHAYHLASAVHTGGFQLIAFEAGIASAADMVAAFSAREDVIIGVHGVDAPAEVEHFVERGAGFIFVQGEDTDFRQLASRCEAALIPCNDRLPTQRPLHYAFECLNGLGAFSEGMLPQTESDEGRNIIVSGRIPGDELGRWIRAGARAVCLKGALYSTDMLESNQFPAIRNLAAAAHQEATRHSRLSTTG